MLCAEFPGRLPSEVTDEIERAPAGLLDDIVTLRIYARAKARYELAERTKTLDQLEDDEMVQLVIANMITIVKAARGGPPIKADQP